MTVGTEKTKGDGAKSSPADLVRTAGTARHGTGVGTAELGIAARGINQSGATVDGNAHPLRGTPTHSAPTPGKTSRVNDAVWEYRLADLNNNKPDKVSA